MPEQLPAPVTTSASESLIDWQRIGFLQSIKTRWTRFKRRNTGSSPSMPGGSTDASDTHPSGQDSISQNPRDKEDLEDSRRRRDAYYAIPFHQVRQRKRGGDGGESFLQLAVKKGKPIDAGGPADTDEDIGEVDEVVVDNSFEVGAPQESLTEPSGGVEQLPNVSMQPGQGKPGMAFGWDPRDKHDGAPQYSSNNQSQHETSSLAYTGQSTFHFLKATHWFSSLKNLFVGVFRPRFDDEELERRFKSQEWHASKMLALVSSGFLVVNWILACVLVPQPWVDFDKAFHYGVATLLTAPLPVLILLHWPLTRPIFYQIYLTCSIWCWTLWYLLSMYLCDYYGRPPQGVFSCGTKDFVGFFYYIIGMPVLGLFALGQWRLPAAVAATTHVILLGALIVPERQSMGRMLANEICYQFFLLYISWRREMTDRDRFIMSKQIKDAYLYRHRLQMKEKQIQTSKQRLTGYIFHEVRVPLNTAMLAVQNIEASGVIEKPLALEFNALSGSLTVMSKVLNDVLDLNRMDAGKFESIAKPYSFHMVLDSLMVPLRMAAAAKQLQLIEDLDPEIDKYALAAYKVALKAKNTNGREVDDSELEPWVVGDEMRLRQVFTNLSSNAVKFSQPGGRIEIVTRLLYPCPPGCGPVPPQIPGEFGVETKVALDETVGVAVHGTSATPAVNLNVPSPPTPVSAMRPPIHRKSSGKGRSTAERGLSSSNVPQIGALTNEKTGSTSVPLAIPLDQIVVRIEVRDAGVGIKPQDAREARLFSPYVQTEIGRYQGGKGTGLGLALVRRIVKLSGGRLGVKSKFNQGSCFWVELPLGVGGRAIQTSSSDGTGRGVSIRASTMPISAMLNFGLPFPDLDELPSERYGQDTPSKAPTLNVPPPAAHFTHRTIMEQQGLVEMTPSRPELRWERGPIEDFPSNSEEQSRPIQSASLSEAALGPPVVEPESLSEPPRVGTTAGASAPMDTATTTILPITPISESPSLPAKQPLTVLVVDDDQLTRKLMTRMLNRLGCVVTTAEHGAAALEMLLGSLYMPTEPPGSVPPTPGTGANHHEPPAPPRFWDLVLLDNQMPKMSGLEAITRLRAARRNDLVVGVTGNALIRDQDEYLGAGVDHVLIKPVLERSIKQMLALAEERQNNPSYHPLANE